MGVDMTNFQEFDNDLQFVEHMVTEESVFCLPGRVWMIKMPISKEIES